ncbi:hypothetical protein BJ742DRAFT_853497 [Cladochytrium replicatum]|nr:hypothetical protein BJ742DRAFT_853497 [Cladochytrium replicatum]
MKEREIQRLLWEQREQQLDAYNVERKKQTIASKEKDVLARKKREETMAALERAKAVAASLNLLPTKTIRFAAATANIDMSSNPSLSSIIDATVRKPARQDNQLADSQELRTSVELSRPTGDPNACPYFLRTGVCPNGSGCRRVHPTTSITSRTILFKNLFEFAAAINTVNGLVFVDEIKAVLIYFEFFKDLQQLLFPYGGIKDIKTCVNSCAHLKGNVYVDFEDELKSIDALECLNGTILRGKPLRGEFVTIQSWSKAVCGSHLRGKCVKGGECNYLHVAPNPKNHLPWHVSQHQPSSVKFGGTHSSRIAKSPDVVAEKKSLQPTAQDNIAAKISAQPDWSAEPAYKATVQSQTPDETPIDNPQAKSAPEQTNTAQSEPKTKATRNHGRRETTNSKQQREDSHRSKSSMSRKKRHHKSYRSSSSDSDSDSDDLRNRKPTKKENKRDRKGSRQYYRSTSESDSDERNVRRRHRSTSESESEDKRKKKKRKNDDRNSFSRKRHNHEHR